MVRDIFDSTKKRKLTKFINHNDSNSGYGLINGACIGCLGGTFSLSGATGACSPCGPGFFSSPVAGICTNCQTGFFSTGSSSKCTSCTTLSIASCSQTTGLPTSW